MKRQFCNHKVAIKVNPLNITITRKYKKKVKERKENIHVVIAKVLVTMPEVVNRGNANNLTLTLSLLLRRGLGIGILL